MTTEQSTDRLNHLSDVQQLFQGIEAAAKLLSMHVDQPADLNTDLVAATMVIAREAERGRDMVGGLMESVEGGAS